MSESYPLAPLLEALKAAIDWLENSGVALRPRDIADIEAILTLQEDLDLARIRSVITEFSEILEQLDYVSQWDEIVKRVASRRQ